MDCNPPAVLLRTCTRTCTPWLCSVQHTTLLAVVHMRFLAQQQVLTRFYLQVGVAV